MRRKSSSFARAQWALPLLALLANSSCGGETASVTDVSPSEPSTNDASQIDVGRTGRVPNPNELPDASIVATNTILRNVGTSHCMDVPDSSLEVVQVIQWACSRSANQIFELRPSKLNNAYSIVSRASGKCLDINKASLLDGAAVIQYSCTGAANQLFLLRSTALGLQLVAQHSKKCITVEDGLQGSGLVQGACTTTSSDKKVYWSDSAVAVADAGTAVATADGGTSMAGTDAGSTTSSTASSSWKNFFAVAWHDGPAQHVRYAKQMGYEYIGINNLATPADYKGLAQRSGLKFYFIDPQYRQDHVFQGHFPLVKTYQTYTQVEKDFYNSNMAWKSTQAFPSNLATGWFWDASTFHVMWDFQQQRVIDMVVENIILAARSFEDKSIGFTFGGVIFDVPRLWGDFHLYDIGNSCLPNPVPYAFTNMSCWTGTGNSSVLHGGISHQYSSYPDGLAAFFKKLNARMKQEFSDAKWIIEPARPFNTDWSHADGWIEEIKDRPDKLQLVPDLISQEFAGTDFVDDTRIFSAGLPITRAMMSSTQPLNDRSDSGNRLLAAKAGTYGAWYNWFGRVGTIGQDTLENVKPSLKLIRVLPNWDNLSNIPLINRTWNGAVYQSPRSFASSDVIYSRHWKTGKLFVVFLTTNGVIRLKPNEVVSSTQRTDSYFVEAGDGAGDVSIIGSEIRLRSSVDIGKGYILTIR